MMEKAVTTRPSFAAALEYPAGAAALLPGTAWDSADSAEARARGQEIGQCFHCGIQARVAVRKDNRDFCCQGCLTVFELLKENGLESFYELAQPTGVPGRGKVEASRFRFVEEPAVRQQLVDYSDAQRTRVTFRLPAIHCIACVWLLEHLFRFHPALGHAQVNFPRKELAVTFDTGGIQLSEVMALLTSLGYEPELKLSDLQGGGRTALSKRLWLQLGVAGFAFGNTMLFSVATYLGLDSASGPGFRRLVGLISLLLAIPVVVYSALDYWRSAWTSLRQRLLNIDVPIAAGMAALFAQSSYDVLTGRGEGYFDTLCGLLFFLLCGRLFQQKTFDRLAFDRDYRAFFPLAVTRLGPGGEEELVAVSELRSGERLRIRHGELIPADSQLVGGAALIDYSFVTGESEPVENEPGAHLYAGGRQMGGAIEVLTVKGVSQGYLTSLWNQEAFRKKEGPESLHTLTNRYSQRFTRIVMGIALGAALYWALVQPALSLKAFTAVLIVACPCALALAAPFTLGTAQRLLARRGVFLRNTAVLERLAATDTVVFDKTGTLTRRDGALTFEGAPLTASERRWIHAVARQSIHPQAVRIAAALAGAGPAASTGFRETAGQGMEGEAEGHTLWIGSAEYLRSRGAQPGPNEPACSPPGELPRGSAVHVAIDRQHRGCFQLSSALRSGTDGLLAELQGQFELALLSGDNDRDRDRFRRWFGPAAELHFQQSPLEKLARIRQRQQAGRTVLMVGDGLNDAGALQQSDVGVAVVEDLSAFSPASDVILSAERVGELGRVMRFSRISVAVVRASFLISAVYNVVGIAIAARGLLAPVICAILMPLSSVSVVAFACAATRWWGGRVLGGARAESWRGGL